MSTSAFVQDEFFESLLSDFLDESEQLLEKLGEDLLALEDAVQGGSSRCDDDLMNEMFRSAHSIKGLSAMLGLHHINTLTHKIENVFDAARKDELPLNGDIVSLIIQSTDKLNAMVDSLRATGEDCDLAAEEMAQIAAILSSGGVAADVGNQADAQAAFASATEESVADQVMEIAGDIAAEVNLDVEATEEACDNDSEDGPGIHVPGEEAFLARARELFAEVADEDSLPDKYLAIFIDETEMSLDTLGDALLNPEAADSAESALITAHRIKGSAASIGLNFIAKLAHMMEDILQELRESKSPLTPVLADALLACTDAIRNYVDGLKAGNADGSNFAEFAAKLLAADALGEGEAKPTQSSATASVSTDRQSVSQSANQPPAATVDGSNLQTLVPKDVWLTLSAAGTHEFTFGTVTFAANLPLAGLKAALILEKLSPVGTVLWSNPPAEGIDDLDSIDTLQFVLDCDVDIATVKPQLNLAGVSGVELQILSSDLAEQPGEVSTEPVASQAKPVAKQSQAVNAPAKTSTSPQPVAEQTVQQPTAQQPTAVKPASTNPVAKPTPPQPSAPAPSSAQKAPEADATKKPRVADTAKPSETLRVDIERLDQLMNLAGQLVISKARFSQIGHSLREMMPGKQAIQSLNNTSLAVERLIKQQEELTSTGHNDEGSLREQISRLSKDLARATRELQGITNLRNGIASLFEAIHQLDRVSDGIHQSVMDTRMVPVGPLFGRFRRVIRDITRANGKSIDLELRGEKTELDKRMIDELGDPLIHMVRNSADHGIESPEDRLAAGKPAAGKVILEAFHQGNSIVIQVKDDGKGLDQNRILEKAISKGIVQPAEAERLTPHQIFQLIWEPGFSTAEKVTEISGRGMGMDIVRSKIEGINGVVEVDSQTGAGTTFTIKLPLTLAILPSLMARVHGEVYAIPIESVVEIVSIKNENLRFVQSQRTAMVRDRVISVIELEELFAPATAQLDPREEWTLVIVRDDDTEIALAVDHLIGEEDCVIKSIAENYQNVTGIAGASILGDGRVSLILDVAALIQISRKVTSATA